jgi:hypothetical protein
MDRECNLMIKQPPPGYIGDVDPKMLHAFASIKFTDEKSAANAVAQEDHTIILYKTITS